MELQSVQQDIKQLKQRILHLNTPQIMKKELLNYISQNPTLSEDVAPWDVYDCFTSLGYESMANMSLINVISELSGTHAERVRAKMIDFVDSEAQYHINELKKSLQSRPIELSMSKLNDRLIVLSIVVSYEKYDTSCQLTREIKVKNTDGIVPQKYFDYFDKAVQTLLQQYENEMKCVHIASSLTDVYKVEICDLKITIKNQVPRGMSFELRFKDGDKTRHRKYIRPVDTFESELGSVLDGIRRDLAYKRNVLTCAELLQEANLAILDNDKTVRMEIIANAATFYIDLDNLEVSTNMMPVLQVYFDSISDDCKEKWSVKIHEILNELNNFATDMLNTVKELKDIGAYNLDYMVEIRVQIYFYGLAIDFAAHTRNQNSGLIRKGRRYYIMNDIAPIAAPTNKTYRIVTKNKDSDVVFNEIPIRKWLLEAYGTEKSKFDSWFYKTEGILDTDEVEDEAL